MSDPDLKERLFDCPHCKAKCQFFPLVKDYIECSANGMYYSAWVCRNCTGMLMALKKYKSSDFAKYYPSVKRKSKINIDILSKSFQEDFSEALICYSNNCYTSSIIMCRRIIQMACIEKGATGKNLYEQIDNMPVDEALKKLAHKIRFWGNAGAHPDIILGQHITEEDALLAIDFAEKFLDFVYIIPADLKALETKAIHDGKEK